MKRFHLHVSVEDLDQSIRLYSTLFSAEPSVRQSDYAKWMIEDPHVNFAISTRHRQLQGADAHPIPRGQAALLLRTIV